MDSVSEAEVGGIFHNGKTDSPLRITIKEISFNQPLTPIKKYNSSAEGIVTATIRQKRSKEMYIRFY